MSCLAPHTADTDAGDLGNERSASGKRALVHSFEGNTQREKEREREMMLTEQNT